MKPSSATENRRASLCLAVDRKSCAAPQMECARSKRNEKLSAIIHYLPLVAHYASLRQGQPARVFLTAAGYRSNDRLPNWKALLNFRCWPMSLKNKF
jgi:hypothetical protein